MKNSWKKQKLRYLIDLKSGDFIKSEDLQDSYLYPVYGGNGISGYNEDYNFENETLIIGRVGAHCGNVYHTKEKIWITDNALICQTMNNYRFMYYVLNSLDLNSLANKTAQPVITGTKIKSLYISYPSQIEQQKIANFLDEATSKIDKVIQSKQTQLKTLEELKKSIIHKAVTKGLDDSVDMKDSGVEWIGDIPNGWNIKKLKYLGKSIIGLTYSPKDVSNEEDGILVLRSANIQNGKMDFNNTVYVDMEIPQNLITQKNDILICSRNGSRKLIGKNILIDETNENVTFGAFMTIFRSEINKYLYFVFNSTIFTQQAGSFMTSTINQLTINAINNMKVAIPPKIEQEEIVKFLDIEVGKINFLKENVTKQIEKLKEYKKSLIYEYVTGKKQLKE